MSFILLISFVDLVMDSGTGVQSKDGIRLYKSDCEDGLPTEAVLMFLFVSGRTMFVI